MIVVVIDCYETLGFSGPLLLLLIFDNLNIRLRNSFSILFQQPFFNILTNITLNGDLLDSSSGLRD